MRYPSFFQEQLTSLRTYWNGHFLGVSLSPDRIQSSKSRLRQFFGGHQPPHSRWIFGISPPVPAKSGAGQNRAFRSQVEAEWWRLVVSLSLFSWVLSICPAETNGILVGYFYGLSLDSYIWLRGFLLATLYIMKIVMTGVAWVLLSSLNWRIYLSLELTTLSTS